MGVENITITVHSYSPFMGVNYIANTGSVVQDIFTNTIEHFEVCATRFIEKKKLYISHMGVQNMTITVHSYSPLMGVYYIANTVQSDSPLISAFLHFVQVSVILL